VLTVSFTLALVACGGGDERNENPTSDTARSRPAPRAFVPGSRAVSEASRSFQISDTVQTLTGIMTWGPEVEIFRQCGASEETWVRDRTSGALERVMRGLELEPYQPFYVTVRGIVKPPFTAGPGVEYGSHLELQEIVQASVEVTRCDEQAGEGG
jgi:hypothetical protein